MMERCKFIFFRIVQAISGIIAIISGLNTFFEKGFSIWGSFPQWVNIVYLTIVVIIGVFLVIGTILELIAKVKTIPKSHRFKFQSEEFFSFFSKWYKQPGTLSIISCDLEWIKNDKNQEVYTVLKEKARRRELNVLLKKEIPFDVVNTLRKQGANIREIKTSNITENYTFSCISVMGDWAGKVIVRDKYKNNTKNSSYIIFDELSNTCISELLNSLLKENQQKR